MHCFDALHPMHCTQRAAPDALSRMNVALVNEDTLLIELAMLEVMLGGTGQQVYRHRLSERCLLDDLRTTEAALTAATADAQRIGCVA